MNGNQTYAYDADGRLIQVNDTPTLDACTTRTYGYEADSNRTSETVYPATTGSDTCQSGTLTGGAATGHSYDGADRLTDPGIIYDSYGRITALPAADADGTSMTLGYYANDLAYRETQDNSTDCFGLDAELRLANTTTYTGTTCTGTIASATTNHYDVPDTDSPSWIAENSAGSAWTANITDLAGNLGATVTQDGSATYQYTDLHGDVEGTSSSGAVAPTISPDYDEFGNDPSGGTSRYGWLGEHQRSAADLGGLVMMGARIYDPALGRFLQADPLSGGSANKYDYCNQDPINEFDLAGLAARKWVSLLGFQLLCSKGGKCTAFTKHPYADSRRFFWAVFATDSLGQEVWHTHTTTTWIIPIDSRRFGKGHLVWRDKGYNDQVVEMHTGYWINKIHFRNLPPPTIQCSCWFPWDL